MYPLDIFLKCILLVILLFCGIISSVSEKAGCFDQRNVRNIRLNFNLMVSFFSQLVQFKLTPEELFASTLKMPSVLLHDIFTVELSTVDTNMKFARVRTIIML